MACAVPNTPMPASVQGHLTSSGHSFTANIPEEFNCSICGRLLTDPHQCRAGHLFCKPCIPIAGSTSKKSRKNKNKWTGPACPTCGCSLTEDTLSRSIGVAALINKLEVTCNEPANARGADVCTWSGPLERFEHHCAVDCMHVTVSCTNKGNGCTALPLRKHIADHERSCPFETTTCALCTEPVQWRQLDAHQSTRCPGKRIPCPAGCGDQLIARRDMGGHTKYDCPETTVRCPFASHGCFVEGLRRKDLSEHMTTALQGHLEAVARGRRAQQLTWTTDIPSAAEQFFESKRCKIGDYEVWLRVSIKKEGCLAVYIYAKGAEELFPVTTGGTMISVGDIRRPFSERDTIKLTGSGIGWAEFRSLATARAAAVDGKISVSASVRLTPPEQEVPVVL